MGGGSPFPGRRRSRLDLRAPDAPPSSPRADPAPLPDLRDVDIRPVPRASGVGRHGSEGPATNAAISERLVTSPQASRALVEQYRKLAATLHLSQSSHQTKVLMVTSAVPAEGKTLTSSNLSLTLSTSFRRHVLLIDADLRRPSLQHVFSMPHGPGLSEALTPGAPDAALPLIRLSPTLAAIPAGRPDPDPVGGLTSERMRAILERARDAFEWVIVDTPPVALLSDAHLLAAMVDAAVLVIRAGSTPYGLIEKAVEAVGRERLVGVVLNRVDQNRVAKRYGYYSYYGYYDSYYGARTDES